MKADDDTDRLVEDPIEEMQAFLLQHEPASDVDAAREETIEDAYDTSEYPSDDDEDEDDEDEDEDDDAEDDS